MTPTGLSARSRALWQAVNKEFRLLPGELLIFEQQLRTLDDLAAKEKVKAQVIARGEEYHVTKADAVRPHPVFAEIQTLRELLQKQAAALDFPILEADLSGRKPHKPRSAASKKAQAAAQARWSGSGRAS
jgi:DNA-binding protein H-NS